MIIIIGLIFITVILYMLLKSKHSDELREYQKNENPFLMLYPLAAGMADVIRIISGKTYEQADVVRFKKLYPKGNSKTEYRRFILHRNSIVISVIIIFLLLSAASEAVKNNNEGILKGNFLYRPVSSESINSSLIFSTKDNKTNEIEVNIRSRRLEGRELEEYFDKLKEELETALLYKNESVDYITSSLKFIESITDTNMKITWRPDDTKLISITGMINNEDIDEEGIITSINLTLTYYEEEKREYTIPVHLYPHKLSEEELLMKEIDKAFKDAEEQTIYEDIILLPDNVMNNKIVWTEKSDDTLLLFLIFGVMAAILAYYVLTSEIKKKEKQREKQMMFDYSNIISKLTLFLSAGMSIRGAWECIVLDYEKKQRMESGKNKKTIHYAYEEMLTAFNEMKVGVSESAVYESFGKRCMLIPYIKLTSIIVQNLKKGTAGILPLLEMEKKQAFSDRKELSKRLGEEAGTKLQAPLMLYLVIVLAIVLIPAFLAL